MMTPEEVEDKLDKLYSNPDYPKQRITLPAQEAAQGFANNYKDSIISVETNWNGGVDVGIDRVTVEFDSNGHIELIDVDYYYGY